MRFVSVTLRAAWIAALLPMLCPLGAPAGAADEPLMIARQGNFYVGGKYVESNSDMPMTRELQ